ncbi:unnamed protein product [Rangifer tarandus platyrhynchus]|uniref:Uncharacterized protein n=1 Tax=Rangifer tarandus platyrhynchus TaxID=3082113 RepID=A0AC59YMV7_RANTA
MGSPKLEGLTVEEAHCSGLGTPRTVPTPLPDWTARTRSSPFLFRSAPHAGCRNAQERASVGPRRCTRARASARERAPGRTRARWRPRGGRRLGPASRLWERRVAAPRPCQSRTRRSGPGPGPRIGDLCQSPPTPTPPQYSHDPLLAPPYQPPGPLSSASGPALAGTLAQGRFSRASPAPARQPGGRSRAGGPR